MAAWIATPRCTRLSITKRILQRRDLIEASNCSCLRDAALHKTVLQDATLASSNSPSWPSRVSGATHTCKSTGRAGRDAASPLQSTHSHRYGYVVHRGNHAATVPLALAPHSHTWPPTSKFQRRYSRCRVSVVTHTRTRTVGSRARGVSAASRGPDPHADTLAVTWQPRSRRQRSYSRPRPAHRHARGYLAATDTLAATWQPRSRRQRRISRPRPARRHARGYLAAALEAPA